MLLGSPPLFHFVDLPLLLPFGFGVVKIISCNPFPYSIKKKKVPKNSLFIAFKDVAPLISIYAQH
jgi:hypothetical protein